MFIALSSRCRVMMWTFRKAPAADMLFWVAARVDNEIGYLGTSDQSGESMSSHFRPSFWAGFLVIEQGGTGFCYFDSGRHPALGRLIFLKQQRRAECSFGTPEVAEAVIRRVYGAGPAVKRSLIAWTTITTINKHMLCAVLRPKDKTDPKTLTTEYFQRPESSQCSSHCVTSSCPEHRI